MILLLLQAHSSFAPEEQLVELITELEREMALV
jgi:hypothetical protein